jgi:23S rRNA pseudouridine1911/1915/1917 synthase
VPDRSLTVGEDGAGARLDVFLAEHVGSRAVAQRMIEGGLVLVDGESRAKRFALEAGQVVTLSSPPAQERSAEPPPASFTVVFEDAHVLVVDKPAGVVVHPGKGNRRGTLVQALGARVAGGDDPVRPGVVHRLDRDTSGLLVLARDEAAHAALKEMIRERSVEREYLTLVEGRPSARSGTIDAPIGRDRRFRTRMSSDTDDPREAVTHFSTDTLFADATLLRVRLETGRTHQIRAHMLAIGHPVCGDPEYGNAGLFGLGRQFLHACRLAFPHPVTGSRVEVVSELPADLAACVTKLTQAG